MKAALSLFLCLVSLMTWTVPPALAEIDTELDKIEPSLVTIQPAPEPLAPSEAVTVETNVIKPTEDLATKTPAPVEKADVGLAKGSPPIVKRTPIPVESASSSWMQRNERIAKEAPAVEEKSGSSWWKWTLGALLLAGIGAAAGGGGGGGGGGGTPAPAADTGGVSLQW